MTFISWSQLFTAVVSTALGIFVYLQGRQKLPNITLALLSLVIGVWCFGQFMGEVVSAKASVLFWTRVNIAAAVFIPPLYLHFILAFISRLKENRRVLRLAYLCALALIILDFTPWFVADVVPRLGYRYYPVPGVVYPLFAFYLVIIFGIGFTRLLEFIKKSEGAINNQAKYVLIASLVSFLGGGSAFFPVFNLNLPVVSHFALPLYLAITIYAIVKHQLLDVVVVIREGLVYSALTVCFASFYVLVILLANRFFRDLTRWDELLTSMLVIFVSVLVFQPLRNRTQQAIDRLFFKGSYYYQKTISDLSAENLKLYRGLLQADKLAALGTIAAGMAHEIKNPLAALKGLTQVLPENLEEPEFIRKYCEIVPRQLDRINGIVENLLEFGQPKELTVTEVQMDKLIDEVLSLLESKCRQSKIEVVKEFSALPPFPADAERLLQALMNVILNAVQAMPRGGVLSIKAKSNQVMLIVEITDSGGGIAAEKLSNIFDPFYTTKEGGAGMGLAVTYRIIKEHAGGIEVESKIGGGTTFRICLPIKPKLSV
jgi:signal transduction histidine kinase